MSGVCGVLPPPIPAGASTVATNPGDVEVGADATGATSRKPPPDASAKAPRVPLENGVPLSQSILFALQRAFYEEHSVAAWSKSMVPNYITTNSFIADR